MVVQSPKKRKQWSEASVLAAIEAVKNGTAVLRAAREHGVPRTTLHDRISGRVVHGTKPGPRPYLAAAEEKELSLFLVDTAKAGYGKSRKEVKGLVEKVARDKGVLKKSKVTDGWFKRFLERQPTLTSKGQCHCKCKNGLPEQGDHVAVFSDVKRCAD